MLEIRFRLKGKAQVALSVSGYQQYEQQSGIARTEETAQRPNPNTDSMRIFISHSSRDVELARSLIDLLKAALDLRNEEIRCTSVDGFRLPVGANINEQLRTEIYGADVLIGLLTRSSLSSTFVAFELGARWAAEKYLVPLMTCGCTPEDLQGPLRALNAMDGAQKGQVSQVLSEISRRIERPLSNLVAFEGKLDAFLGYADLKA